MSTQVPSYMAGSLITSTATFTSTETGEPADPDTITVKIAQRGSLASYTYPDSFITRSATGVYSCEIDTTGQSGPGVVEWIGTGAVQAINAASWITCPAPL